MGEPTRTQRNRAVGGRTAASVLVYASTGDGRSLQGGEDVYVLLDGADRVIGVYYPDLAPDRRILDGSN
jgi:hypothetical protein